jgi:hypothetical protein
MVSQVSGRFPIAERSAAFAGASATIRKSNGTRGLTAFGAFGPEKRAAEIEGEKRTDAQYVTGGHK